MDATKVSKTDKANALANLRTTLPGILAAISAPKYNRQTDWAPSNIKIIVYG